MDDLSSKIQRLIDIVHVEDGWPVDAQTTRRLDALARIDSIFGLLHDGRPTIREIPANSEPLSSDRDSVSVSPQVYSSVATDALLATFRYHDDEECEVYGDESLEDIVEVDENNQMYLTHLGTSFDRRSNIRAADEGRCSFLDTGDLKLIRHEENWLKTHSRDTISTNLPLDEASHRDLDNFDSNTWVAKRQPVRQKVTVVSHQLIPN